MTCAYELRVCHVELIILHNFIRNSFVKYHSLPQTILVANGCSYITICKLLVSIFTTKPLLRQYFKIVCNLRWGIIFLHTFFRFLSIHRFVQWYYNIRICEMLIMSLQNFMIDWKTAFVILGDTNCAILCCIMQTTTAFARCGGLCTHQTETRAIFLPGETSSEKYLKSSLPCMLYASLCVNLFLQISECHINYLFRNVVLLCVYCWLI